MVFSLIGLPRLPPCGPQRCLLQAPDGGRLSPVWPASGLLPAYMPIPDYIWIKADEGEGRAVS